ncbi:Calcipressin-domain-containing protein [Annulohypoxylon truncatum]|uniref:Calcipressin-domain-containing protein n=1 Tax=Annulohypoxylon truncatum TaxID=327061 RepID=UPI002007D725|nr:Calcipressin-domain-containing protein [Annulohypoxylon truncatum]KAI1210299.1 Calcipressin-domain-containing protein [Annulohypoxylon truncatum]
MSGSQSPTSTPSSPARPLMERRGSSRSLSLDFSSLPPLTQPTPPTNTLLITNLNDTEIFRPDNLQTLRELIQATAPVYTWSPLKSFRRIVVSFFDEQSAIRVRAVWDGEAIMGERCKVYFGQPTPLDLHENEHLKLPDAGKLFFISPPPSPPHGWEMKLEDAPNKLVHAEDLAEALSKLRHQAAPAEASPVSPVDGASVFRTRSRSSTLIYHPDEHGGSPNLPAISVDDMTDDPMELSPSSQEGPIKAHTARPPVELME